MVAQSKQFYYRKSLVHRYKDFELMYKDIFFVDLYNKSLEKRKVHTKMEVARFLSANQDIGKQSYNYRGE